jgi:plastocyanin
MKKLINSEKRYLISIILLLAILGISNSCSKDTSYDTTGSGGNPKGTGGPGINEVWIQGMAFNPATITVNAGTTIKWTNKDNISHTVSSNTGAFESGTLGNGQSFSFKFEVTGNYPYYCKVHPTMTATVVVN